MTPIKGRCVETYVNILLYYGHGHCGEEGEQWMVGEMDGRIHAQMDDARSEYISEHAELHTMKPFEQVQVWLAARTVRNPGTKHMSNSARIEALPRSLKQSNTKSHNHAHHSKVHLNLEPAFKLSGFPLRMMYHSVLGRPKPTATSRAQIAAAHTAGARLRRRVRGAQGRRRAAQRPADLEATWPWVNTPVIPQ